MASKVLQLLRGKKWDFTAKQRLKIPWPFTNSSQVFDEYKNSELQKGRAGKSVESELG